MTLTLGLGLGLSKGTQDRILMTWTNQLEQDDMTDRIQSILAKLSIDFTYDLRFCATYPASSLRQSHRVDDELFSPGDQVNDNHLKNSSSYFNTSEYHRYYPWRRALCLTFDVQSDQAMGRQNGDIARTCSGS